MKNSNCIKIVAVLAALMMVTVSCASPLFANESDADVVVDDTNTEYGMGFAAGLVLGLVVGVFIGMSYAKMSDPVGDQEDVYKQLRQIYGKEYMLNADTIKDLASSILPADTSLWSFTSNYWNRAAELVVAELWNSNGTYNPNITLEYSLMRENVQNYIYDWQSALDKAYNNILNQRQYMIGDCYGDMSFKFSWTSGSLEMPRESLDTFFGMDFCQAVIGASAGQYVYIDTDGNDVGGTYADTSGYLYNFGQSKLTLTKMGTTGSAGNVITVQAGSVISVKGEESGMYRIETENATFMGPLSKASSVTTDATKAADVVGSLVMRSGNSMYYAIASGDNVTITSKTGSTTTASSLNIVTTFTGTNLSSTSSTICDGSKYNLVRDWNNLVQQINYVVDEAALAGEVIWGIFDEAQASNSYISPSSLTQTVNNVNMSAGAKKAITVQGMMYIADYWQKNGGKLTDAAFITNTESESLLIHGDIYYKGQLWMQNAVFTPFLTVSTTQTLTVGKTMDWKGPGFAMVWAQTDNFIYWNGSTDSNQYTLLNLDSDYSIEVKKIKKNDVPSSASDEERYPNSVTLTPTVIKKYTTDPTIRDENEDPVKVLDSSTMILIILIELAIIIMLIGYILGQPVVGIVVGLVVVVVGMMFSHAISDLILGTFSWRSFFG